MKIAKKLSACVLSLAVLGSVSGCIPSPYEQNVPATTYTVDENGNKVKVQHNASTEKTSKAYAAEAADAFYTEIFSGNALRQMTEKNTGMEEPEGWETMTEDEKAEFSYDLMTSGGIDLVDLVYKSDKVSKKEYVEYIGISIWASQLSQEKLDVVITEHDMVAKGEDTVALDIGKIKLVNKETKGEMGGSESGNLSDVYFSKIDGVWKFDVEKSIKAQKEYEKAQQG